MRIYMICPVRNVTRHFADGVEAQVNLLESKGHRVYYPPRDTDDENQSGLQIFRQNRKALENADIVYFTWDGSSEGCLIDLGVAFALRKPIRTVERYIPHDDGDPKSLIRTITEWEINGAD